jgi:hypothetical protein
VFVGLVEPGHAEFVEQPVERHPVQRVEIGPRQFAGADPVHRRRVFAAPGIGELGPIDAADPLPAGQRLAILGHPAAPIDDGAEHVMHQGHDLAHALLPE